MSAPFVHLHVHSEYSILDGACRIPELAARAAELEMPAVTLTDHGSLAGAVELYRQATALGIKPLVGCEVYVADDRKALKKGYVCTFSSNELGAATATLGRFAKGKLTIKKVGKNRFVLKFTKKARKQLKRRRRAKLKITTVVTDRAGNSTRTGKTLSLKR